MGNPATLPKFGPKPWKLEPPSDQHKNTYGIRYITMVYYGRLVDWRKTPLYPSIRIIHLWRPKSFVVSIVADRIRPSQKSFQANGNIFPPGLDLEMFTSRHGAFAQRRVLAAARPAVAVCWSCLMPIIHKMTQWYAMIIYPHGSCLYKIR